MSKFKVGDRVVISKPHDEEEYPYWSRRMDCMTFGPVVVEEVGVEDPDCVPCFMIGEYIYAESWAEIASASDPTTLTRRDRFAMAALTGLCANCDSAGMLSWTPEGLVDYANQIADLMEAARNRENRNDHDA